MNVTREVLLAKKAEAEGRCDMHRSGLNAAIGAINTIDHLLAILDLPEPPPAARSAPPKPEAAGVK